MPGDILNKFSTLPEKEHSRGSALSTPRGEVEKGRNIKIIENLVFLTQFQPNLVHI